MIKLMQTENAKAEMFEPVLYKAALLVLPIHYDPVGRYYHTFQSRSSKSKEIISDVVV